jgi:hypothetical protein
VGREVEVAGHTIAVQNENQLFPNTNLGGYAVRAYHTSRGATVLELPYVTVVLEWRFGTSVSF